MATTADFNDIFWKPVLVIFYYLDLMPIYCQICCCSYELKDLLVWTGRDSLDFLCPGCDDILFSPRCFKCCNSATMRLISNGKIYYCCDEHDPYNHHDDDDDDDDDLIR